MMKEPLSPLTFLLVDGEHEKRLSSVFVSGGPSGAMDVRVDVLRTIHLHDPIHAGKVETTRSNVGGEQHRVFATGEEEWRKIERLG